MEVSGLFFIHNLGINNFVQSLLGLFNYCKVLALDSLSQPGF